MLWTLSVTLSVTVNQTLMKRLLSLPFPMQGVILVVTVLWR